MSEHTTDKDDDIEALKVNKIPAPAKPARDEASREIQDRLDVSEWSHCENWYRHPSGRITSNWPGSTLPFAKRTKVLEPEAFSWS